MVQQGFEPSISTYVNLLKGFVRMKALSEGMQVHANVVKSGSDFHIILGNTLIDMYAKSGSVEDAQNVFDKMHLHNVFSWTAVISAYAQQNQVKEVVEMFQCMLCTSVVPDKVVFIIVLKACSALPSLELGKQIHDQIIKIKHKIDVSVGKALVEMYKKCGNLKEARQVFRSVCDRDVVLWTSMISGYVQEGLYEEALLLFEEMEMENVKPNDVTFVTILKACAGLLSSEHAKHIHAKLLQNGYDNYVFIENSLIDMYVKCGCLENAWKVFNKMPDRDVIAWTTITAGYAQHGLETEAFALLEQMEREGVELNDVTYISILKACATQESLGLGRQVHTHIARLGFHMDISVGNCLIDMYAKCGRIVDARHVFEKSLEQNMVSWTAMVTGYAEQGLDKEALELIKNMQMEGVEPDKVTFVSILKVCGSLKLIDLGKQIHVQIMEYCFEKDVHVGSALIDMYAKCGNMGSASKVFEKLSDRDVVSWTAMISGHLQQGLAEEALTVFEEMEKASVMANNFTFVNILTACTSLEDLEGGKTVHSLVLGYGVESDVFIGSSLVDMYAKCGSIEDASQVFDNMCEQDVVSWNAMIAGYVQGGLFLKALVVFEQMQFTSIQPDIVTLVSILTACAGLGALERGKEVHCHIIERGFELDSFVASTLVDMYAKCGTIDDAHIMFNKMDDPDLISWNAVIGGFAQQGLSKEAITLFEKMQCSCLKPDTVTFGCVLSACSHGGLLDNGCHYFNAMSQDFGIMPLPGHYACMVDLLGRAGHLYEAEDFINKIPIQLDTVVWMTLLGACKHHSNVTIGQRAFDSIINLEPKTAAAYVLISNIFAAARRWDKVAKIRKAMEGAGLKNDIVVHLD